MIEDRVHSAFVASVPSVALVCCLRRMLLLKCTGPIRPSAIGTAHTAHDKPHSRTPIKDKKTNNKQEVRRQCGMLLLLLQQNDYSISFRI